MKTGMVVLNYNDALETIKFVNVINNYNVIDHLCIVDNASTDKSLEQLKSIEYLDKVEVISNNKNRGYAVGNNVGLQYLYEKKCDNYIIANPDIIINRDNLLSFIKYMNEELDYQVFGPTIEEHGKINRGWKQRTILYDILSNIPILNDLFAKSNKYHKTHYIGEVSPVDCVSGCFWGIKSEVIDKIGYLDEGTFLYYEEDIFGAKIKKEGLHSCILNEVYVIHNHSVTINKNVNQYTKIKMLKQSQLYYHQKYFRHAQWKINILKGTADFACACVKVKANIFALRERK